MAVDRFVIVGINGQFGRIFARKLNRAGAVLCGIDLADGVADPSLCQTYVRSSIAAMTEAAEKAIADADYVLLCVPEEVILAALPRLCELMRDDALLMDIASVKTRIGEALSQLGVRAGYLSIHPMFGPTEDFSGQAICVVPMHENRRAEQFMTVIGGWGARVARLTAEQHDSATALVQALPHAALIAFGAAVGEGQVSFEMLWSIATPIQKIMLSLAARLAGAEHDTYWSIQSANPFAGKARRRLETELGELSAIVGSSSWPEFSAKLDAIRRFLSASGGTLEELAAHCVSIAKE